MSNGVSRNFDFVFHQRKTKTMSKMFFLSFLPLLILVTRAEDEVSYKYQEFLYKGNSKNVSEHGMEIAFGEFESACEQTPDCLTKKGPAKMACVQMCISPSCHQELYGKDPLEEGEIDVRLNSFKGCFVQRINRPRH